MKKLLLMMLGVLAFGACTNEENGLFDDALTRVKRQNRSIRKHYNIMLAYWKQMDSNLRINMKAGHL